MNKFVRAVLLFAFASLMACNNPSSTPSTDAGSDRNDAGNETAPTDGGPKEQSDGGPITPPVKTCLWGDNANGDNCESGSVELTYLKYANHAGRFMYSGAASAISADGKTLAFAGSGDSKTKPTLEVWTLENNQWTLRTGIMSPFDRNPRPAASIALSETGDACATILGNFGWVATRNAGKWSSFEGDFRGSFTSLAVSPNQERIALSSPEINQVRVYRRSTSTWTEEAVIQSPYSDTGDAFGASLAFSGDGTTLFIGANGEDSGSDDPADNSKRESGAVHVFELKNALWTRSAYLKAKEGKEGDLFGSSLSVSSDGKTLVVGANGEDSVAKESGAVYIFERFNETEWAQKAVLKSAFAGENDNFGHAVALSGKGEFLIVGAPNEDSSAIRLNGNADNNDASDSGAAYLFRRQGENWLPAGYVKAMNTEKDDRFGFSVAISKEGRHILIGAPGEDGASKGVNGNLNDNAQENSGAVYLYEWKSAPVGQ